MAKTHKTKDGAFEFGYVAKPSDMAGKMADFRPHWWAQAMSNGAWSIFSTRKECEAWIADWYNDEEAA